MRNATVLLPVAPITGSPVPGLTSIHSTLRRGEYGSHRYPGNCGGYLIRDLLTYFDAERVFDPMSGSGTCRDVCDEVGIACFSSDIRSGFDVTNARHVRAAGRFDFVWLHPPYWRMKVYSDDPRDLSTAATLDEFLDSLSQVIVNCRRVLRPRRSSGDSDGRLFRSPSRVRSVDLSHEAPLLRSRTRAETHGHRSLPTWELVVQESLHVEFHSWSPQYLSDRGEARIDAVSPSVSIGTLFQ